MEDGEDNVQDRMIKTPLKQTDLVLLLKEVVQVVAAMPKFTLAMGERPEKTVTYILDVLGKLGQQRVALMDAMRAATDAGGSSLKAMQTYGIRNSARNAATTTAAKSDIMATAGDDVRILGKIVELAFVPISTALAREMPGDSNHHGIRDIGDTLKQEFFDVMTAEDLHVLEEEFLDVEEEILDVMEAENLHVIEEERSVPVSAPRKPKGVKLMAPLKLIRSGKMADRSGNRKVTKHMARKHVRSDGMVLNFDEIVPEEGAVVDKGNGKKKAHHYAFRRRRFGHNGRRLRFRADDDGWVTVMKGAKRDAEREITMPVYSATYSGKGINHRTNARSMARQRNDVAQYDRELRCKIDRRAAQRALELANRKMKNEKKRKAGAKRAKEAFDRLARQDTSVQAEDKLREIAALRRKQINSGKRQFISARCRFVVDIGEKMSGDALNAGFQFARSKVPNAKA